MTVNLAELSHNDLLKLLSKQSRKLIRVAEELRVAYTRLALHECKGASCARCKGGAQ